MLENNMKPIWYFVGLILLVMGALIALNGIYLAFNPPVRKTVLSEIHPDIWWGALMFLSGGMLYLKTRKASA